MALVEDYVKVWRAWDDRPSDVDRATAMVVATQKMVEMLGVSHMVFRHRLNQLRGEGRDHAFCVRQAIEQL